MNLKKIIIALAVVLLVTNIFIRSNKKTIALETVDIEIIEKPLALEFDKVEVLIDAIEEMEGNYAGTIATKNNNPCNLRWGINQLGKRNGFSYFKDYETGRKACRHQIEISADGRSSFYSPEMTLLDFFNVYAPSSDNNQPNVYYEFVIEKTGFNKDMKIKELLL